MLKYAIAAGICASLAPIFMKLAFAENIQTFNLQLLKYIYFICFALSNICMWFFHSKALQASDSTIKAVVLNTGTNFVVTGILGWIVFGEQQSFLWAIGISCIIAGISLIASDKPQIKID
uniref:EamA domain-containing protein n=1 Tax=Panagrolaimus sp. PS1159 TaxID=55785 RepID=A0AC35F3I4_9BILA